MIFGYKGLTTRQLNTAIQVNNMGMLHLTQHTTDTYVHHIIITIRFVLHTSSISLGRPAGPDPSCGEHYMHTWLTDFISIILMTKYSDCIFYISSIKLFISFLHLSISYFAMVQTNIFFVETLLCM